MKQLENILNLTTEDTDDDEEIIEEVDIEQAKSDVAKYCQASGDLDKIDEALPMVEGLEEHDREMDELAAKATEAYTDLLDLGFNVDTKYSSRLFEVAGNMLGHAITAKNSKVDKKLKMLDLQLKKQKLDQAAEKADEKGSIKSDGEMVDRNSLLRELLSKNRSN